MDSESFTAFDGTRMIVTGPLEQMLAETKAYADKHGHPMLLIFDDQTGKQVDFDLRGDGDAVLARARLGRAEAGPGRPKLGVVSREVSLLPRHWDWLAEQSGGASAALRRLVDEARKRDPGQQAARRAQEAAGRFLTAMAGNLPGYEEATRALWAGERGRFERQMRGWPADVRRHAVRLAEAGLK